MSSSDQQRIRLTNYMGCYGRFGSTDRICRNHCAIRIRCAIETEHNMRMEFLEDLFEEEDTYMYTH